MPCNTVRTIRVGDCRHVGRWRVVHPWADADDDHGITQGQRPLGRGSRDHTSTACRCGGSLVQVAQALESLAGDGRAVGAVGIGRSPEQADMPSAMTMASAVLRPNLVVVMLFLCVVTTSV